MAYNIPPGNKVALPFDGTAYTIPAGNKVALRFGGAPGSLFAVGFDASLFGTASIVNATQQLFTVGWDSGSVSGNLVFTKSLIAVGIPPGVVGSHSLQNLTKYVTPGGIPPVGFGAHRAYLATIFPVGINAFAGFGTGWVSLFTRRIGSTSLGDQSQFGTASMAGGVRWLDLAGRSIVGPTFGAATAWYRNREMFPAWFVATSYGKPVLDFNHGVEPVGFGGDKHGQPEVYRPRFIIDLAGLGIASPGVGDQRVDLHTQFAAPTGWLDGGKTEPERFGRSVAYNLLQYIAQLFEVSPYDGGVFGTFNYVDNRNKQVRPDPINLLKLGTPELRNNARILKTPAFVEFTLWGSTLVAPAIRELRMVGEDTSQWGSRLGNIVYNAGRVLAPAAIAPGDLGKPEKVWSNQQTLKARGLDHLETGLPMVADRVRTVGAYSVPGPLPFGNVDLQLWERYVAPRGQSVDSYGVPNLEIHWTIIAAKSVLPPANAFGDGRVRNLTPELPAFGWTATEWGKAQVYNQFEKYALQGWESVEFGRHVVKDRRQTILPPGLLAFVLVDKHQIRKVLPDPPAPQTIVPVSWQSDVMGSMAIRTNVIAPKSLQQDAYGTAKVVSNGILPRGITPPYNETGTQFGMPGFNGTPAIFPNGIKAPDDGGSPALPDVGPRYIWAPQGYPYKTGYWQEQGRQMDWAIYGDGHPERPVFGAITITHRNRTLAPSGTSFIGFGQPSLTLRPQYVRPTGTSHQRFGFPVLNGGGAVEAFGFDMAGYGRAILIIPDYGPKTVKPNGIGAPGFGGTEAQLFNRELQVKGWIAFTVSAPVPPSWPRQSTWVSNAYAPFPAKGSEHGSYGTPWVSFYKRFVAPAGWSALLMESTPGSFRDRMKVYKQMWVRTVGTDMARLGAGRVSLRLQGIAAAGRTEAVFGVVNARKQNRVNVPGFDALEVGDVQRWLPDTIQSHGDDMAALGRAVLHRVVRPLGIAGGSGSPSVAHAIGPAGLAHSSLGTPVAVARWCGDKAMAVDGFAAGAFGAGVKVHEA